MTHSGHQIHTSCWRHSSSARAYLFSGLGGPSRRTGPQADFERPAVSPLRSDVTTSRSVRVVRWVEPSGRLRSRPESAAVWSWHVPKSAPWLVGRGGDEPHWVSIVLLCECIGGCPRHVTLRISAGTQHRGRPIAMAEWPAQGCIHVVAIKRCVDGSGVTSTTSCAAERLPSRAVRYVSFANTRAPSFSVVVDQDDHRTDVYSSRVDD